VKSRCFGVPLGLALTPAVLTLVCMALPRLDDDVHGQTPREHHPQEMFDRVLAMHRAVVRGDLQALHSSATWVAEQAPMQVTAPERRAQDAALKQAAARAAAAADISRAAAAIADVVSSCGTCHQAFGVVPTLPPINAPRQTSIVGHMLRHARAAEEMLHGMVVPSDRMWLAGTTAFAETPLAPGDFPVDFQPGGTMAQIDADVHRFAQNAFAASTPPARALAYGRLLGTCAGCRQRHARP
jgi:hypothetical protein